MRFVKRLLIATAMLASASMLRAQSGNDSTFPAQYGPNNAGTEFYFSCPANWDLPGSSDYYIRIYITSTVATEVEVWTGPTLKRTVTTVPFGIVTVDLSAAEAQPVVRNDQPPVPPDRLFKNKAVRIVADEPVVAYVMNRTTFTSEGMLLLPTNALGGEYIVGSYGAVIGVSQELPSQYVITAPYHGTTVQIYHPHRTPNHAAGETFTINMDKGDVYSAMTVGYNGDMSGAVIKSDKPVAVVAGQACTYIPNLLNFCCCDHIVEMMLPTESWGKIYHAVPFATRLKGDFYRIFAKEQNTKVYVNGLEYATLNSVGGEEGTGWFEYRALARVPVEFTANKPITVFQYNTSQAYDGVPSDPFYMQLTPLEQYGRGLVFSTPNNDFPQNFLNIVTDEENFDDIEISRADENNWRKLIALAGTGVPQQFATKYQGKDYVGATVELEEGGAYKMRAPEPFTGYSYGFGNYDSYGYPIGVLTADLTIDDSTPPGITVQDPSCEGRVSGTITSLASNATRVAALSTVNILEQGSSNFRLEMPTFQPGISTSVDYTLVPVDPNKPANATIYAVDMAGNAQTATVVYAPGSAINSNLRGDEVAFPNAVIGTQITQAATVENTGAEEITFTFIGLVSGSRGFTLSGPLVPVNIQGNGTLSVDVTFAPTAAGTFADTVLFFSECGLAFSLPLQGVADGSVLAAPLEAPASMFANAAVVPNPARGDQASVGFTMMKKGAVSVSLVDASGKELRTVADALMLEQGEQTLKIDLSGLPSGNYFVRISADGRTITAPLAVAR